MKLVTGPQAAREKEVELRLQSSGGSVTVVIYENGKQVDSPVIGSFTIVDGKIEFQRHVAVNRDLVHRDGYYIRCV